MGYRFSLATDLSAEVARIERQELEEAFCDLETPDPGAVHEARKHLKKLRALLEAIKPALSREAHAQTESQLRHAGRALASARDSAALLESFDHLTSSMQGRAPDSVGPDDMANLRALISVGAKADARGAATARDLIALLLASLDDRKLKVGRRELVEGVADTYGKARKRFRRLGPGATGEEFHELRQQVKYHQHHLTLLEGAWPEPLAARRGEASRLAETLGQHHDLMLLELTLFEVTTDADKTQAALEAARLHVPFQRERLETEAIALSALLFVESREAFSARLGAYVALARGSANGR